jgi:hypothetical protein
MVMNGARKPWFKPKQNKTKPASKILVLVCGFWNQNQLKPDQNHGLKTKPEDH